jgi:hypothetical protein
MFYLINIFETITSEIKVYEYMENAQIYAQNTSRHLVCLKLLGTLDTS